MAASNVSKEELHALLPHIEVSDNILKAGRRRIALRCIVVFLILFVRIIVSLFFPEYHMVSLIEHKLMDKTVADTVLYVRLMVLVMFNLLYVVSFKTNSYFRTVNVIALVLMCSLITTDFEIYMMSSIDDFTWQVVTLAILRFVALWLIFLNYLEVRR